jgi:uncharacterized protein YdeI (YjbR/CyaY-like superfamily)
MPVIDPRIDAYIKKSADFAQPILLEIRKRVHAGHPDVVEAIKWGFPHFMYQQKILCSMAAFKAHCALGFWQRDVLQIEGGERSAMGDFGRLTSVKDLPPARQFTMLIKEAAKNIAAGTDKPVVKKAPARREPGSVVPPDDFAAALKKNRAAQKIWDGFSYSQRKEYVDWIVDAKRDETRTKRITEAVATVAEGKSRNWKYERPKA